MEYLTNNEAAEVLRIKPNTLRESLCRNGNYFGVYPKKSANGRLMWPKQEIIDLLNGKQK